LLGELTQRPDPLAVFKGPTSKGRAREGGEEKGKRRGSEGLPQIFWPRTAHTEDTRVAHFALTSDLDL